MCPVHVCLLDTCSTEQHCASLVAEVFCYTVAKMNAMIRVFMCLCVDRVDGVCRCPCVNRVDGVEGV